MNWSRVFAVAVLVTTLGPTEALWGQTATPACGWQGSQQWLSTRPSPLDSAQVALPGGVAKICYSRPSLRGRSLRAYSLASASFPKCRSRKKIAALDEPILVACSRIVLAVFSSSTCSATNHCSIVCVA